MTARRVGRRLLILLALSTLLAGAAIWTLRQMGRWLVTPDPLEQARVIVVLGGRPPFRALEAAEIFRQGWAPEVWMVRDHSDKGDETFAKLGIPHPSEHDYDRQIMERLGVPKEAIRILDPPATNTLSEIMTIAAELRRQGGGKAIVVTSPMHTRRVKAIWHAIVGNHAQAIVRYDTSEPSDPEHWWRTTQDVEAVEHETLGLIDAHLGFAIKPVQE